VVKFGIGIWDAWEFCKNLYDIWVEQDKNYFEKIKETRKAILGFIGETIFGSIGVEIGVGLMNPGVWQFIMVFCLAYFLSKLGGWIFGKINDLLENVGKKLAGIDGDNGGDEGLNGIRFFNFPRRRRDDDDDDDGGDPPFPPCPAFAVSMRSGGAEFHLPRQINNFTSFFSFNKCHYIAFEYEDLDIEEIINLVNSKFLINNIKVKNLDEIYDTILKEIAYGFLCKNELPSISLNFNKDGLLYSIMNNYYKNTLTGNILTFLDYYLKSYANGSFFKEEFILNGKTQKIKTSIIYLKILLILNNIFMI